MRVSAVYRVCSLFLVCVMLSCILSERQRSDIVAAAAAQPDAPDVIVDPGHGGVDGGAVGVNGTVEKDINLLMAEELKNQLEAAGLRVLMTRTEDVSIHDASAKTIRQQKTSDLKNRLDIINTYPDALFVSIHQNSLSDASVRGAMVYYGTVNPESKTLAQELRRQILLFQPENRKEIKQAQKNLYLLSNAASAAVLVECGFLTNAEEETLLGDGEYRARLCGYLRDGIVAYLSRRWSEF